MADVDNLKTAEQFNKVFSERRVLAAAVTREMRNQLELATQIATIVGGMKPEEIADKLASATKVIDEFKEKSKEAGDQSEKAMKAVTAGTRTATKYIGETDKQMKVLTQKFPTLASVAVGTFSGLVQGFKNTIAMGRSAIGMAVGFADGVLKISKSIVAIPLKIFRGMIDLATDFSGDTSFLQALENLRKEFGNFKEDVSKNVLGAFKSAQTGITGTGLSTFRVLGTFAQQLEYFNKVASDAGAQFHYFGKSIADEAGKFVAFEKGLGIGTDHVKAFLDRAKQMGTTWQDELGKTANYSLQMGEAFGISQKVIGKDIAYMMKDVKNFGGLTQKEMSVAAIYTRKLGIEINNIANLMDKFDTFENAANSAAQLSQAFGTSVDAFKLMQAQSPAEKLDMLRKSMAAAGKTTENMSYQEKKLLAQTVGLDEATSNLAFSAKNQGVSMDQIKKKASEAENAPLRQAQALEKLAASIERVVMSGQMFKGGFIEQFLHGFEVGIKSSPAFMNAILAIRNALQKTMYMGVAVGKMFIKTFAGGSLEKSLGSITEAFRGWDKVMDRTKAAFAAFFVDFDVRKLIDNFKNIFIGHFSSKGAAGSAMVDGIKGTFQAFVKVVANGGRYVVEELTKGLARIGTAIRSYLKDPKAFMKSFDDAADNMQTGFIGMIRPLVDLVKDEKLWKDLYSALTDALKGVWELVKKWLGGPTFMSIVGKSLPMMFSSMVAPAAIRGGTSAIASSLASMLFNGASKGAASAAKETAAAGKSSPIGPGMMTSLFGNPYVAAAALVAAAGVAGVGMSRGMDKFYGTLEKDFELKGMRMDKKVGASVAGIVQLLSFGQLSDEASLGMARSFTQLSNRFNEQLNKLFGFEFARKIRADIENRFDFLINFGNFIGSLVTGDVAGAAKSFFGMFTNLYAMVVGNLRMIFLDIPNKIIEFIASGADRLAKFIDDMLASPDGTTSIWKNVQPFLTNLWTHMLEPLLHSFGMLIQTLLTKLPSALIGLGWSLIKLVGAGMEGAFKGFLRPAIDTVFGKGFTDALFQVGNDGARGLWNGFMNAYEKRYGWAKKVFEKLKIAAPTEPPVVSRGAAPEGAKPGELVPMEPEEVKIAPVAPLTGEQKMVQAQTTLEGVKAMEQLSKMDVQKTIDTASAKLEAINMDKLNDGLMARIGGYSNTMTEFTRSISASTETVEARLAPVLKATQEIISSVRELDTILATGDATKVSISKNLSKFANNAGLGGNEKYTIQNKGVQINIDMKVVMNAEELEEALVLRSKSMIKEAVKKSMSLTDDQLRDRMRAR